MSWTEKFPGPGAVRGTFCSSHVLPLSRERHRPNGTALGVAHAERVESIEPSERCESCGSPEVARRQKLPAFALFAALTFGIGAAVDNTLAAFYIVLAGIVFFLAAGAWRCRHCGHTW